MEAEEEVNDGRLRKKFRTNKAPSVLKTYKAVLSLRQFLSRVMLAGRWSISRWDGGLVRRFCAAVESNFLFPVISEFGELVWLLVARGGR